MPWPKLKKTQDKCKPARPNVNNALSKIKEDPSYMWGNRTKSKQHLGYMYPSQPKSKQGLPTRKQDTRYMQGNQSNIKHDAGQLWAIQAKRKQGPSQT